MLVNLSEWLFCQNIKWKGVWHVIYIWKDGARFDIIHSDLSSENLKIWENINLFDKVQQKISTLLKQKQQWLKLMWVNLHTYMYNIELLKLRFSIHIFYISCPLSSSEMTGMGVWVIIGIRMTQENGLVLKTNLYIKMSRC